MKRILVCLVFLLSLTTAFPTHAQDSLNVTMVGQIDTQAYERRVAVLGDYAAYVANWGENGGLATINIDDPNMPVLTEYYNIIMD